MYVIVDVLHVCMQVQKMITEVFSSGNITVLPSSSFTSDQDVSDIKKLLVCIMYVLVPSICLFFCFNRLKTPTSILSTVLKTRHLNLSVG